jgi:S1-C subfamily serine protease
LLEVGGTVIERVEDLQRLMTADLIGQRVDVTLLREGSERQMTLVPAELDTSVRRAR